MTTWFTADLHFNHELIIQWADRPFADVNEMNERLITNWNSLVSDEDEVWILGDFAKNDIAGALGMALRLKGTKVLVMGNHDLPFLYRNLNGVTGDRTMETQWLRRYSDVGLHPCRGTVYLPGPCGRTEFRLDHFPYQGDRAPVDRYQESRPSPTVRNEWLLHGHTHYAPPDRVNAYARTVDVGVDAWMYAPVNLETLRNVVRAAERSR